MKLKLIASLVLLVLGSGNANASGTIIEKYVSQAEIVGQGRMTYLLFDVYDAVLFAPQGEFNSKKPFALKLSYLRPLKGKSIADRSVEEIRNQGFTDEANLSAWQEQMRSIFPDVDQGTQLIGIYTKNRETVFYRNAERIGKISDPEFGKRFFDIWLNPKTSAPELRATLLNQ